MGHSRFGKAISDKQIAELAAKARQTAAGNASAKVFQRCLSYLDLTSLGQGDSVQSIAALARKTADLSASFPHVGNVASLCVYPIFVDTVGLELGDSGVRITAAAGGFPAAQTYLEVKMLEVAMAVENGADEVDVVLPPGLITGGELDRAQSELEMLRVEAGEDVTLKIIIESGVLPSPELIHTASMVAMEAGADFVKTSTGKAEVGATVEAAVVICSAIRSFYEATGKQVGFKAAGGIRTAEDAVLYYSVVQTVLGEQWLVPELFRIGTSSAADALLSALTGQEVKYF